MSLFDFVTAFCATLGLVIFVLAKLWLYRIEKEDRLYGRIPKH
jgi:hypothetical protein